MPCLRRIFYYGGKRNGRLCHDVCHRNVYRHLSRSLRRRAFDDARFLSRKRRLAFREAAHDRSTFQGGRQRPPLVIKAVQSGPCMRSRISYDAPARRLARPCPTAAAAERSARRSERRPCEFGRRRPRGRGRVRRWHPCANVRCTYRSCPQATRASDRCSRRNRP